MVLGILLAGCGTTGREIGPSRGAVPVARLLQGFIEQEMLDKRLRALSVAVMDGSEVAWSRGFGVADPARDLPATPWTVYRVGSVSKLLTDIAIMQKVEVGRLDLDAPITRYLPGMVFDNPHPGAITLRHLMTHHAGIRREPPLGNYFDPTPATVGETVRSLRDTPVIYRPGARLKYSNAGLAVVGHVLEAVSGQPFFHYMQEQVLQPAGLDASSFIPTAGLRERMATGVMWTRDGEEFPAPTFEPGMQPAGNLYSSVLDLGWFGAQWFDAAPRRSMLGRATMRAMFAPQFPRDGKSPIGLGFFRSRLDGELVVGHGGAIYGFATALLAMPAQGFAVAVVNTHDCANAVSDRVARYGLELLLAQRRGRPLPRRAPTLPVGAVRAAELAGWYRDGTDHCRLFARGEELLLDPPAGFQHVLRARGDGLVIDDRIGYGGVVQADGERLTVGGRTYARVREFAEPELPAAWREYLGSYGWPHNMLRVFARCGELCILIEWFAHYPVRPAGSDTFRLGDRGMYAGETVRFRRAADGRVDGVWVGGVLFPRR